MPSEVSIRDQVRAIHFRDCQESAKLKCPVDSCLTFKPEGDGGLEHRSPLPNKLILGAKMQWSFRIPAFLSCHTGILSVSPGFQSPKNAFRTTRKDWNSSNPGRFINFLKLEKILTIRKLGTDTYVICLIIRVINSAYCFSKLKVCDKYKREIRRCMFITFLSCTQTQTQTTLSGGFHFLPLLKSSLFNLRDGQKRI